MNRNVCGQNGRVPVPLPNSSLTTQHPFSGFPVSISTANDFPPGITPSLPLHSIRSSFVPPGGFSAPTVVRAANSLHTVRAATQPGLEMQSVLNSGQSSIGSLFRPSPTIADPNPRIFHTGQYGNSLYTTANSTLTSFSSLYSIHGQPAGHVASGAVSPYNTFYPQYPQGYSPNCLLSPAGHYPHLDSYSAVLASMGSHAQHVSQSQLPRTFMPTHVSQYSPLSTHRNVTPTTSPSSAAGNIGHSPSAGLISQHSPKQEQMRDSIVETAVIDGYSHSPRGVGASHSLSKEDKSHSTSPQKHSHHLSPLSTQNKTSSLQKDNTTAPKTDLGKDLGYKLPSGKEGSLKHRILTRPPNIQINESPVIEPEQVLSAGARPYHKSESISPAKRSKSISEMASSGSEMAFGEHQRPHQSPLPPSQQQQQQHQYHQTVQPPVPGSRTSPEMANALMTPHLHYPPHFMKGSIIQLANGDLKRVEDLQTNDFIYSAEISTDLKIDSSTVVRTDENIDLGTTILSFLVGENKVQVTVEATLEHPFFVFGKGWSSCCPQRTIKRYGLDCHKLSVGDVCISLTHKEMSRDKLHPNYHNIFKGTKAAGKPNSSLRRASITAPSSTMLTNQPLSYLNQHRNPQAGTDLDQKQATTNNTTTTTTTTTHSTETQTNVNAEDIDKNCSNETGTAAQQVRKRRWSAPDNIKADQIVEPDRPASNDSVDSKALNMTEKNT
ncbi:ataxin-1-like [Argonauta hians]